MEQSQFGSNELELQCENSSQSEPIPTDECVVQSQFRPIELDDAALNRVSGNHMINCHPCMQVSIYANKIIDAQSVESHTEQFRIHQNELKDSSVEMMNWENDSDLNLHGYGTCSSCCSDFSDSEFEEDRISCNSDDINLFDVDAGYQSWNSTSIAR